MNDGRPSCAWIGTYSGKRFWPLQPRAEEICIEDVAHGLALQCRFNGHCARFYSVAEHCWHVSRRVRPENALWGLLHDAAEAYLGDMVSPLKRSAWFDIQRAGGVECDSFGEAEARLLRLIGERFGLAWPPPAEIKEVDRRMCATEYELLFAAGKPAWPTFDGVERYAQGILCDRPEIAEYWYLRRFNSLTSKKVAVSA